MSSQQIDNRLIFWGVGASGWAALVYELVWSRSLTNTIGGTTYSFSILLAAFMAGLAVGGHYGGRFIKDRDDLLKIFGFLQLGIGLFGALALFLMNNLEVVYGPLFYQLRVSFAVFQAAQLVLVFIILMVPTTLMGAVFPVAVKAWAQRLREIGQDAGDVYSINTWGAVVGCLSAGFVLIPLVGLKWANLFAVSINMVLAFLAFTKSRQMLGVLLSIGVAAFMPTVFLGNPSYGLAFGYGIADHFGSYAEYQEKASEYHPVFVGESAYGRVQVLARRYEGRAQFMLVNGGRIEGSSEKDATNQKLLAALPLSIHKNPSSVLNIGLGTGMTLATATQDKRLRRIDDVEINPAVYEAVDKVFYPDLFDDPRVEKITDDARHYLVLTKTFYDIIISEPSYPTSKSESHLFTREFYQVAKSKLADDGIFVQWLPGYLLDRSELAIAAKTMAAVFPNLYAWESYGQDIILVGLKDNNQKVVAEVVANKIKALNDKSIRDWAFSAGPDKFAQITADSKIPMNLDNLPRIEFSTARRKITGMPARQF